MCSRFYSPSSLPPSGQCPTCGRSLAEARRVTERRRAAEETDRAGAKVPWHFWLLLVGVVGYLGWRVVQGFDWLWRAVT